MEGIHGPKTTTMECFRKIGPRSPTKCALETRKRNQVNELGFPPPGYEPEGREFESLRAHHSQSPSHGATPLLYRLSVDHETERDRLASNTQWEGPVGCGNSEGTRLRR